MQSKIKTVTRRDWCSLLHSQEAFSGKDPAYVDNLCKNVIEWMSNELALWKSFYFKGLGHLGPQLKKARSGRNPKTGETHYIESRVIVKFTMRCNPRNTAVHLGKWFEMLKQTHFGHHLKDKQVRAVYETFLSLIRSVSESECRIEFRGFGTFSPSVQSERVSRNPKTGAVQTFKPKTKIIFMCSKNLSLLLNSEKTDSSP